MMGRASAEWQASVQLAGKLALSAAALLLLALAYRFCKPPRAGASGRRQGRGEPRGKAPQREAGAGEAPPGPRRRRMAAERDGGQAGRGAPAERRLPAAEEEEGERGGRPPGQAAGLAAAVRSEPGWPSVAEQGTDMHETACPGGGLGTGMPSACTGSDGCAQSTEEDLPGLWKPVWASREVTQTFSVTSNLGLTMRARDAASNTSYSFSSVAKIQVEESYIPKRQAKAGGRQAVPGLKGKVYDYFVQSTSQSVSKRRSHPYIQQGITPFPNTEQVTQEQQGTETQLNTRHSQAAALDWESQDHRRASEPPADCPASPILPQPAGSSVVSYREGAGMGTGRPEPSGRKGSILHIAENPHLQVPMGGLEVVTASGMPASPQPAAPRLQPRLELVTGASFFQMSPALEPGSDIHLDLGNCYEVLCMAKAQRLGRLQEAAYKVMSDNYLQVLKSPSIYGGLDAGERELILQRRMKGKKRVAVADISTPEPGLHTSRLCYYDDAGDRWHHLCHVPPEVVSRGGAACSMFNYLFVVAGCSKRVFCYNPLTNTWREICPLNQARPRCKLVALDGCLYAIGGECLSTVERYDPRQDRWAFAAPLPNDTFAVAHTATVCDGEIYVTGGTSRYLLLRYAACSDTWKVGPAGGSKDRTAEMVTADGFIYRFDLNRSMGIGVYRCSAKAKLWYECATYAMPYPACFQCVAVGRLVHCLGRHFHLRFLADNVSPRFGAKELQPFPAPRGSLLPAALVLPEPPGAHTQV